MKRGIFLCNRLMKLSSKMRNGEKELFSKRGEPISSESYPCLVGGSSGRFIQGVLKLRCNFTTGKFTKSSIVSSPLHYNGPLTCNVDMRKHG